MKYAASTTAAALATALMGSVSSAQTIQSAPFDLLVTTANGAYKNATLQSCHVGAGFEALCVGYGAAAFGFNYTENSKPPVPGDTPPGVLTYTLQANPSNESQAMSFSVPASTNVGYALFTPEDTFQQVIFSSNGEMGVPTVYDDLVTPPTDNTTTVYYRWYVCETNYEAYRYETLNWVYGKYPPENPSCLQATVTRAFLHQSGKRASEWTA